MPVRLLRQWKGQNVGTLYVGADEDVLRATGNADDRVELATNYVAANNQTFRAFANTFSTTAAPGSFVSTVTDPFAGQNRGFTMLSTVGTVPAQLALSASSRSIAVGTTAGVDGTIYSITVTATSGDGLLTTQPVTLNFKAVKQAVFSGGGNTPTPTPGPTPSSTPFSLRTTSDLTTRLATSTLPTFAAGTGTTATKEMLIDTSKTYQTWMAAGAALTDSAAYVLMTNMTLAQRTAFLTQIFSPTQGLGLNFVRLQMGDSDYTTRNPNGGDTGGALTGNFSIYDNSTTDDGLASFSTAQDQTYIIPVLQQILAINPNVQLISTPWTPPKFYKTNGALAGGDSTVYYLNTPANNTAYAQYFVKYQQDLYAKIGKYGEYTTVNNEPNTNPGTYPGCRFNGTDIMAVGVAIASAFSAANIPTKILSGDDSWGSMTANKQALYPFQNGGSASFVGAAYHAYYGSPSQTLEMAAYPGKYVFMTEFCTLNNNTTALWAQHMGDVVIASPAYGAQAICFWNLALDPTGQPGTADNLQPVASIATDGTVTFTPQYFALAHLASYVKPGAVRVASTTFGTLGRTGNDVQTISFKNPDGSVASVLYNSGTSPATVTIKDQQAGNKVTPLTLIAQEVRSVTWKNAAAVVVPDAPSITAAGLSATTAQVSLNGNTPANGGSVITGYDIWQSSTSGNEVKVASNVSLPYSVSGLTAGNPVFFKAAAVNSAGSSILSSEVSATPSTGTPAHALVTTASNSNAYVGTGTAANRGADNYVDMQVRMALNSYAADAGKNMPLAGRWKSSPSNANSSWLFALNPSGAPTFLYFAGSTVINAAGNAALTSAYTPTSAGVYLRGLLNVGTAAVTTALTVAGQSAAFVAPAGSVSYFYSTDGVTWNQLGTTVTGITTTSLPQQGIPLVGHTGSTDTVAVGNFFSAIHRDTAAIRFNPDFTTLATGTTTFNDTAPTPNAWTVNTGSGASIS